MSEELSLISFIIGLGIETSVHGFHGLATGLL